MRETLWHFKYISCATLSNWLVWYQVNCVKEAGLDMKNMTRWSDWCDCFSLHSSANEDYPHENEYLCRKSTWSRGTYQCSRDERMAIRPNKVYLYLHQWRFSVCESVPHVVKNLTAELLKRHFWWADLQPESTVIKFVLDSGKLVSEGLKILEANGIEI